MKEIKGKFEIKSTPLEPSPATKELGLMHMKFEKKFSGPLHATSVVSMMGMMNQTIGSGGYVAMEKLNGEVESKKGSFFLQHSCFMTKGVPQQAISVVPDSGTDELSGIRGEMKIDIVDGQHLYTFNYEIPG